MIKPISDERGNTDPLAKVIVFGGSGFLGSAIAQSIDSMLNADVQSYSSKTCDLMSPEATADVLSNCDNNTTVVFSAGITPRVTETRSDFRQNVAMVQNFLAGLPAGGIRSTAYVSTSYVYGHGDKSSPIREDTRFDPEAVYPGDAYAQSMIDSEKLIATRPDVTGPLTVLRMTQMYGSGDGGAGVVGRFIANVREDKELTIRGRGVAARDFLAVSDAAKIVAHLVETPVAQTLNVASGTSHSISEVAAIIGENLGKTPKITYVPSDDIETDQIFDLSLLKSVLPEFTFSTLSEGVSQYIQKSNSTRP